jgi:hypothetical protein
MWRAERWGESKSDGIKRGTQHLRTIHIVEAPVITPAQKVRAAIYCAKTRRQTAEWSAWAAGWLNGTDRSFKSAENAACASSEVAYRSIYACATDARAAAHAASRAALLSDVTATTDIYREAIAQAAEYSARSAAVAADTYVGDSLAFDEIIRRAIQEEP